MAVFHISEAELARDLHSVLEKVRQGDEVVVEQNASPVAVIKRTAFAGRPIDDCISSLAATGSHATLDHRFGADLEAVIERHREPLQPPAWD